MHNIPICAIQRTNICSQNLVLLMKHCLENRMQAGYAQQLFLILAFYVPLLFFTAHEPLTLVIDRFDSDKID